MMTPDNRLDPAFDEVGQATLQRFRRTVTLASAATVVAAVAGLLGYVPGLRILGSIRLDYRPMALSTAICLLVLSAALYFHARRSWQGAGRLTIATLVLLVTAFGLLEVIEQVVGMNLSLEDWIVPELGTLGGLQIGRMSPLTGAAITLAGIGTFLLLLPAKSPRYTRRPGSTEACLGLLTMLIGSPMLLSYVYGTPLIYGRSGAPMAATAAIAVICLGVALIASAGPLSFPTCLIVGDSTAPRLARAGVPIVGGALLLHGALYHAAHSFSGISDAVVTSTVAVIVGATAVIAAALVARSTGTSLEESVERLRESEAQYRAITQSANDAIVTSDGAGIIVGWNPGAEKIFGYPEFEAIGQPVTMLMPEEFRALHTAATRQVSSNAEPRALGTTISLTGLRKDGLQFPIEMSLSAWTTPADRFFTGIIRDITARNLAIEALRESEQRYKTIIEAEPECVKVVGATGDLLEMNAAGLAMLEADTVEEVQSRGLMSLVLPEYRAAFVALQEDAINGTPGLLEFELMGLRGTRRWLETHAAPLPNADGRVTMMLAITRDITEHKLAAVQLQQSEASLAITLQSIGDAVIATDGAGLITRMNATAERLTGWSQADATGRAARDVFQIVDARTRAPVANPVTLVLEGGSAVRLAGNNTLLARNGAEYQIADSAAPIRDTAGQMVGVVLVFSDFSEEYRVRKELADTTDLLQRTGAIAMVGGWRLDLRTNDLVWSQETSRLHEVDPSEIITVERAINFYTPEARPVIQAAVQAAIDIGTPFDLELPLVTATGRSLWVRAQGSVVREYGKIVALHGAFQDITDRRHSEDALRSSEEWHRTILQTAMVGLLMVDAEGHLVEVNDTYCRMSGYSERELLTMRVSDLEVHDTSARIAQLSQLAMTQGEISLEGRHRRKDGTQFDVDVRIQFRPLRGGLVVTLLQDITARKQAEAALVKSEALFRTIFAEAPLGVAVIDSFTGHILEVNARFAAIAGRTVEEMTTLDWMSITHPDDVQPDLDYMAQMNAGQIPGFTMVKRYRRPDDSYAWIRMTIAKMTISRAGHPQHLCMIDDITERKRTTDELQVRSRVLEQSPASIVITDRDGNIEYVNPRFEQVTGYTKAEVVGKNPRILKSGTTPPETYIDMWATIAAGGDWHGELCNRRKNGELYWEYAAISGLADDSGKGGHFVAVKEDITARKHAERQQAALQDQLAQMQKMESIGLLAGGVAHDFNNMLAAILGYAELVMLKLGSGHAVHPDVLAIRTAAQRSADLTGRLLAFARKQTMAPKVLVLNDTIESMLTILGRLLGEHVRLKWLPGSALWSVEADRTQIDQVLTNLAVNARDAMTGHKAVLEISTANVVLDAAFVSVHPGARAGEFVHLGFRDGGSGMDAITRAHLFEPFFTTKEPGQGTGLGLSVVHGIVTQHRGFVYVESAPGLGSTFHLYFPRCDRQGAEIASPAQPLRRGTGTILLAEDEEGVRAACAKMLRAIGYTVLVSRNGEAAMEVAASHREPIQLLLTDVIMPGMNGAQLRDRLLRQRPNVKVLFMSGYAGSVISTEGVLTTGTHFIQKPFTMHELAEAVHAALDA